MTQINEAIDGKKLIELLMQALDEGDSVRITEYVNQMLSQKVSECLQDRRVLISEQLFVEGPRGAGKAVVDTMNNEIRALEKRLKKMSADDAKRRPTEGRLEALRKTVARAMKEDLATDLVKVSNLNRNKDSDSPELEDEQLPNMELATDDLASDDTFDEGSESVGLDTFRE